MLVFEDKGPVTSEKEHRRGEWAGPTLHKRSPTESSSSEAIYKTRWQRQTELVFAQRKVNLFSALTCPAQILSAASAQEERSLTERQKHRSQDAPSPLPLLLKGTRPRGQAVSSRTARWSSRWSLHIYTETYMKLCNRLTLLQSESQIKKGGQAILVMRSFMIPLAYIFFFFYCNGKLKGFF